jgi:hypothetical protein
MGAQRTNEDVIECLERHGWCRTAAVAELGISAATMTNHIRRARLSRHIPAGRRPGRPGRQENTIEPTEDAEDTGGPSVVCTSWAKVKAIDEQFGGRWAIQVAAGNFERARQITDQAEEQHNAPPPDDRLLDVDLDELRLPARLQNMLLAADCFTIGDFARLDTRDILAQANVGPVTIDTIWRAILTAATARETRNRGEF